MPKVLATYVVIALALGSFQPVVAEGLDLGAEVVTGKKDQPEAMTFVSRAPLDERGKAVRYNPIDLIRNELKNNKRFDLVYEK